MSIWQFPQLNQVPEDNRLSMGEGNTPLEKFELAGIKTHLKREDLNPNGSFKDRSLAYQLSYYLSQAENKFVISSSGNAAISAAAYVTLANEAELDIFVSTKVNSAKLKLLETAQTERIRLYKSARAKSDAIKFARDSGAINLRGSVDDQAIPGFKTIAYELEQQLPTCEAIFTPTSSGTSAVGIYQGFAELNKKISLQLAQTQKIHPFAKEFTSEEITADTSLADAITDRVGHRKQQIMEILKSANGQAWIITDAELKSTKELLKNTPYQDLTYNSLLGLAALIKARDNGVEFKSSVVIISGR